MNSEEVLAEDADDLVNGAEPECCCCETKIGLHKDGWYGYRCDSDDCIVF